MPAEKPIRIAYYCSGHGYGHATRVAAFTELLQEHSRVESIHIVSSVPRSVFGRCLDNNAHYRFAEIDPIIEQPVAYHVDRHKSVQTLKLFLQDKQLKIDTEVQWLRDEKITCVLSDAVFLACIAAHYAEIPSVLVTNFTFDSVYSYLSTSTTMSTIGSPSLLLNSPNLQDYNRALASISHDEPVDPRTLEPLVNEILDGYSYADLLLRLPGSIPIPSFFYNPHLPSTWWVQDESFGADVIQMARNSATVPSRSFKSGKIKPLARQVIDFPLLSRMPSSVIASDGAKRAILQRANVPVHLLDYHVLVVSFGGQIIRQPALYRHLTKGQPHERQSQYLSQLTPPSSPVFLVSGAPPVVSSPAISFNTSPLVHDSPHMSGILPEGWIAIVCGIGSSLDENSDLPERFFVAPSDVYMPDITAISDVLLGKLGYGTVSECLNTKTPLIYVPRPLFIEEYGLKELLHSQGVGVKLSRTKYEQGKWSDAIIEALSRSEKCHQDINLIDQDSPFQSIGDNPKEIIKQLVDWIDAWD